MRSRDIPDSYPGKWAYTEHTRAKHEILSRYLGAWLSILGHRNPDLVLMDGFAGKGQYSGGQAGSPKIMFDRAVQIVEDGRADRVLIQCVERDPRNFAELEGLCCTLTHPKVKIEARHGEFAVAAEDLAAWAATKTYVPPIFVMADPFGFAGVPLPVIKRLMAIPRAEVLVTFMARDMSRFLGEPNVKLPLKDFFGGDIWRKCLKQAISARPECLLLQYRKVVQPGVARFATPFRVFEDLRRTVLYYLVHLTNNARGMREMKEAMVRESGDMTFWPVTVRPTNQLEIDVSEAKPYPTLQRHLAERYAGRALTFVELLNDDYPDGVWVEKEYRAAIKALEGCGAVTVSREHLTPSGKPATRGIQEPDRLSFA